MWVFWSYITKAAGKISACTMSPLLLCSSIAVRVLVSHCAAFLWWPMKLTPLQTGTQVRWQKEWPGHVYSLETLRFGSDGSTCSSTSEPWCGHWSHESDVREEAGGRAGHLGVSILSEVSRTDEVVWRMSQGEMVVRTQEKNSGERKAQWRMLGYGSSTEVGRTARERRRKNAEKGD